MKIIIDAMGGDKAPLEIVKGAAEAARTLDVNLVLVGDEKNILSILNDEKYPKEKMEIVHAPEVITNYDQPTKAIKEKKSSSLVIALKMLKEGKGEALVSAGNTGALLAGSLLIIGRIKGVKRPALAPALPSDRGASVLLDAGANTDINAQNLFQFALMGSIYARDVFGMENPRVGLVNIGAEETKGNELTKAAYPLLAGSGINFCGNLEARDIPAGIVDVIVCDGFVGNVILKLMEGLGLTFYGNLKQIFMKNTLTKIAAVAVQDGLRAFKKKMDYTEYGGAPLLGIDKVVIKAHGSSNAKAFFNAIRQAEKFAKNNVIEHIREAMQDGGLNGEE